MMRIVIRAQAEADIREAVSWYDSKEPELGGRFIDDLKAVLGRVRAMPLQFPMIERGVRRALFAGFPYALYFVLRTDTEAVVLAVLHQHRHPSRWKKRGGGEGAL